MLVTFAVCWTKFSHFDSVTSPYYFCLNYLQFDCNSLKYYLDMVFAVQNCLHFQKRIIKLVLCRRYEISHLEREVSHFLTFRDHCFSRIQIDVYVIYIDCLVLNNSVVVLVLINGLICQKILFHMLVNTLHISLKFKKYTIHNNNQTNI